MQTRRTCTSSGRPGASLGFPRKKKTKPNKTKTISPNAAFSQTSSRREAPELSYLLAGGKRRGVGHGGGQREVRGCDPVPVPGTRPPAVLRLLRRGREGAAGLTVSAEGGDCREATETRKEQISSPPLRWKPKRTLRRGRRGRRAREAKAPGGRFPAGSRSVFCPGHPRRAPRQLAGGRGAVPRPRKSQGALPEGHGGSKAAGRGEKRSCGRGTTVVLGEEAGGRKSALSPILPAPGRAGNRRRQSSRPRGAPPGGFLLGNKAMSEASTRPPP